MRKAHDAAESKDPMHPNATSGHLREFPHDPLAVGRKVRNKGHKYRSDCRGENL